MKTWPSSLALLVLTATPALAQSEGALEEVVVEEFSAPPGTAPVPESAAAESPTRTEPVTTEAIAALLARYAKEPSVDEVVKAALAAASRTWPAAHGCGASCRS
jgi:hypothetical protein